MNYPYYYSVREKLNRKGMLKIVKAKNNRL